MISSLHNSHYYSQEVGSEDLDGIFPTIQQLGLGLVTILDQLRIRTLVTSALILGIVFIFILVTHRVPS